MAFLITASIRAVESVLLASDAGEEVAADPLKVRLPDGGSLLDRPLDERRYSDADWSEVERRRNVLLALANHPTRTAGVAAAAEALGLTPRCIWALLRHARMAGHGGVASAQLDIRANPGGRSVILGAHATEKGWIIGHPGQLWRYRPSSAGASIGQNSRSSTRSIVHGQASGNPTSPVSSSAFSRPRA
jgi:hypothetical protein